MLLYHVRIALKSLRRSPGLSVVIVGGIALGIGVASLFSTVRHSMAKDPIPGKSDVLHYVRLDSWDPARAHPNFDGIPTQLSYRDAMELMKSDVPARQTAMFKAQLYVFPDPKVARAQANDDPALLRRLLPHVRRPVQVRLGLGPQGRRGAGAGRRAGRGDERPAVRRRPTASGKSVRIEDREFRVVGVLDTWRPSIKFYDITSNAIQPPGAGLHAVQLRAADADPHRGQQRRLEERARSRVRGPARLRPDLDPDVGGAARRGRHGSGTWTS